jgi:DNA replication and repair protein RecF
VYIEWIQGVAFRSYPTLSYSPSPQLNVLTGPNGHGKTNLLEALGVLLVGRSFRGAKPVEMARWDTTGTTLSGEVRRGELTRVMRREIRPREDASGAPSSAWVVAGEGCPWTRAVPFGWQDLAIVNGAPQARRNFVDGFAGKLVPAHLTTLARYRQVLTRRNHLLQAGGSDAGLRPRIEPWDEQLARVGTELIARRRQAVDTVKTEVERIYVEVGGAGAIRIEYRSGLGESMTVERFRERLEARRGEELRRGQTLVGPHRDDLGIELDGHDLRTFGSRGQQRLVALVLRLAEVAPVTRAVGSPPVLLLDDALSELDPDTQGRVLRQVESGRDGTGQVFLTTAEPTLRAPGAAWWEVRDGLVDELTASLSTARLSSVGVA